MGDEKSNPTKDPEFKRVLGNLLKAKPKRHSEMVTKKPKTTKTASKKRGRPAANQ